MTLYDILCLNSEVLNQMQQFGINQDDFDNIKLFEEYRLMKQEGIKTLFIVRTLCDHYHKSERSVYRLIKRYNELRQEIAPNKLLKI